MIWRALGAQKDVRLLAHSIDERFCDSRLANLGFAAKHNYLNFTAFCLPPALDQKSEFLIAGDEVAGKK